MRDAKVLKYMTPLPHSIGRDQKLATAHKMMRELGIRHLPVLEGGKVLGILSDRDLYFVEALKDVDPNRVTVEEAMTAQPYSVSPNTLLRDVVLEMAEHKYGSAVVMDHDKLIGVLTTTDLLKAFAESLGS